MKKIKLDVFSPLEKIRKEKPVVHHLTNWVTIYDCANISKAIGASPVMAHAKEEVAQMAGIASSLVLNIGTLTPDFVEAMKAAARAANKKGIPVVLDVCGAGATALRNDKVFELLDEARIDIIKGNASEIARVCGKNVLTKGVDSSGTEEDLTKIVRELAAKRKCTVVATGKDDVISDAKITYIIKNGTPMLTHVVGTGCMCASIIGAFAAVEPDLALASAAGLICFEVAAELAQKKARGPASFKTGLFDIIYSLAKKPLQSLQKAWAL